jgi:lipopolysaccharide cholinephosphotransferase
VPEDPELTLEELREVQLEILTTLDRVCREHGLTCYLAYGTLLGAVRHGGFVPWDDDVDVMMPRTDYERLPELFRSAAPAHLSVAGPATRDAWPLPYVKVSDDRTRLVEPLEDPVEYGVNVDVFPLDAVPRGRFVAAAQRALLRALLWALELRYIDADRGRGWHHPLTLRLLKPALRVLPVDRQVAAVSAVARWGARRPSRRVGIRVGSYDWSVPQRELGQPSEVTFEGTALAAPRSPERVLEALYGDWRRLPPEAERVTEHAFVATWHSAP